MQDIQDHNDGTSEGAWSKQVEIYDLKKIFYKNETTFTFDKYVTKLKGEFNVLDNIWWYTIWGADGGEFTIANHVTKYRVKYRSQHI